MYKSYPTGLMSSSSVWEHIWFILGRNTSAVSLPNERDYKIYALQIFSLLKETAEPKVGAILDATLTDTPSNKIANIFTLIKSVRIGL